MPKTPTNDGSQPLPNIRHELFCQHRASGTQQTEAYIKAGYKDTKYAKDQACKLASTTSVTKRIQAISAIIVDKVQEKGIEVTRDTIRANCEETYSLAKQADNHTGMNAANVTLARTYGLLTDKVLTDDTDHKTLTEAEQQAAKEWVAFSASPEYPDLAAYAARQARDKVRADIEPMRVPDVCMGRVEVGPSQLRALTVKVGKA